MNKTWYKISNCSIDSTQLCTRFGLDNCDLPVLQQCETKDYRENKTNKTLAMPACVLDYCIEIHLKSMS